MSARNKFLTTLLSFLLLIQFIPSAQATLFPGFPQDSDIQALTIEDQIPNTFSFINNNAVDAAIGRFGTKISESPDATRFCDEFNTHGCNVNSDANLSITSLLPICGEKIENCIESLEFIKQDGTSVKATFDRYMKGKTFQGIPDLGMPGGSRVSLWNAPGIKNLGGTEQYAVNTQLSWNYRQNSIEIMDFNASVFAIKPVFDSRYKDSGIGFGQTFDQAYGTWTETGEIIYDGTCAAVEIGMCAQKVEFAPDTRIKLNLKL